MGYLSRISFLILFFTTSSAFTIFHYLKHGTVDVLHVVSIFTYSVLAWIIGSNFDRVRFHSECDALTNVYNRRYVQNCFPALLQKIKRENEKLCVAVIDVNRFKEINDTYGHKKGDYVIQTIAETLLKCAGKEDIVSRWGGDEFLLILPRTGNPGPVIQRIHQELKHLSQTLNVEVSVSIGYAVYPDHSQSLTELIKIADSNMYHNKYANRKEVGLSRHLLRT